MSSIFVSSGLLTHHLSSSPGLHAAHQFGSSETTTMNLSRKIIMFLASIVSSICHNGSPKDNNNYDVSKTDPRTKPIVRGLNQLDLFLEANVETDEPQVNLAEALSQFNPKSLQNRIFYGDIVKALQLIQSIIDVRQCDEALLDSIGLIRKTTVSYAPNPIIRINKIIRPFALEAAKKCDLEHERRLDMVLEASKDSQQLQLLFSSINDEFIEAHLRVKGDKLRPTRVRFREKHPQLNDSTDCCSPLIGELSQLLNTTELKSHHDWPEHLVDQLEYKIMEPCETYLSTFYDVMEKASECSYFGPHGDDDQQFVERRSRPFQHALFRYKFCAKLASEPAFYFNELKNQMIFT